MFSAVSAGIPSFGDLAWHRPVFCATVAPLSPANTYAAGVLTATANGILNIDTTGPSVGNRILVRNEATAAHNGVYVMTQKGDASHPYILTRASDANTAAEVAQGSSVVATVGVINAGRMFVQRNTIANIDTDAESWQSVGAPSRIRIGFSQTGANVGTYTPPTGDPGFIGAWIEAIGTGGGGAGAGAAGTGAHTIGGGGGGGGYCRQWVPASTFSGSYTMTTTVVAGGGVGGANGQTGGNTTVTGTGVNLAARGGVGGATEGSTTAAFTSIAGGVGGTASGGDIAIGGAAGHPGIGGGSLGLGGAGAPGPFGGGGNSVAVNSAATSQAGNGAIATDYGAGGGGACVSAGGAAANGGVSGPGLILVTEVYSA